jgi:hypothetical protein
MVATRWAHSKTYCTRARPGQAPVSYCRFTSPKPSMTISNSTAVTCTTRATPSSRLGPSPLTGTGANAEAVQTAQRLRRLGCQSLSRLISNFFDEYSGLAVAAMRTLFAESWPDADCSLQLNATSLQQSCSHDRILGTSSVFYLPSVFVVSLLEPRSPQPPLL